LVPDIGEFQDVDVIEVLVAPGERVAVEQALITLESDKATMEIPAPWAGVVKALHVAVGDKVSEGSPILTLEVSDEEAAAFPESAAPSRQAAEPRAAAAASPEPALEETGPAQGRAAAPPPAHPPVPGAVQGGRSPAAGRPRPNRASRCRRCRRSTSLVGGRSSSSRSTSCAASRRATCTAAG
jgi:pyruvate/2-oxoglutarate dehydrogenase complex dihydrolipoamide acyltransferase (E2) component